MFLRKYLKYILYYCIPCFSLSYDNLCSFCSKWSPLKKFKSSILWIYRVLFVGNCFHCWF